MEQEMKKLNLSTTIQTTESSHLSQLNSYMQKSKHLNYNQEISSENTQNTAMTAIEEEMAYHEKVKRENRMKIA